MKAKIFITLLFISTIVYSQTVELEKKNLEERFIKKEFPSNEYVDLVKDWRNMITEIGGYPELPYDEKSKQIKFKIVHETGEIKKTNFNRILEWSAINFGDLGSVLQYKDYESGKIVIKGWFDITHINEYKNFWGKTFEGFQTTKCYQTYVFTIKDNTIKTEIVDVQYKFKRYGYYTSTLYTPDRTLEMSIHRFYPITNFESDQWKEKLDLLNQTSKQIAILISNLNGHIEDYSNDYSF